MIAKHTNRKVKREIIGNMWKRLVIEITEKNWEGGHGEKKVRAKDLSEYSLCNRGMGGIQRFMESN
jgi:hypothetical protein